MARNLLSRCSVSLIVCRKKYSSGVVLQIHDPPNALPDSPYLTAGNFYIPPRASLAGGFFILIGCLIFS